MRMKVDHRADEPKRAYSRPRLVWRQFYALIWKDFVIHKRHYIWTMLEVTIPILVCAMAILSNSHQGKPKLEPERLFDADDYERLYGDLNPARHRLLVAPNTSFTRALVDKVDDGAVTLQLVDTEAQLVELIQEEIPVSLDQVKRLLPDESSNVTIGGVLIRSDAQLNSAADPLNYIDAVSKLDGSSMRIPLNLDLVIRAKDFRLGPAPFPKKYSLGPYLHGDHYSATFFMASQLMLSRAYISLLAHYALQNSSTGDILLPANDEIIGQRMPYPKYVAHRRLKETTLGTFVAGSQKQKPFVLTMDYCLTIGFLVTAIFLAKRLVDERKNRVRDMLRLVGISDWIYFGSHMTNTILIMALQCIFITVLFTGHPEAPGQNIDSTLMFTILIIYSVASIMFVLAISNLFASSTRAIIFTSLAWFGLPEVLDRIFKIDSGVIENNGFLAIDERYYLLLCLLQPNFALRLMNRLLTECDIYGEFYSKKQLYGEYRAIWWNIGNILPLYKSITIGHVMGIMLVAIPVYIIFIYLYNSLGSSSASSIAGLSNNEDKANSSHSSCYQLIKLPFTSIKAILLMLASILKAPFKLVHRLLIGTSYSQSSCQLNTSFNDDSSSISQFNQHEKQSDVVIYSAGGKEPPQNLLHNLQYNKRSETGQQVKIVSDNKLRLQQAANGLSEYFEEEPSMLSKGVSIRNLCKTYQTSRATIKAVRNVSLDMFYSQILVLLGHNGAGKTTLIDIISGHNDKTSGTIHIDGYNIDTQPGEARRRVGFCPQFDVLFERLTVQEHLYFYGLIKGAHDSNLQREINQLLEQSGLDVHERKLSKALSGGYKRKLSLAIAMIADSKVLILDEPTSGMDPESRRKVWDFLQLIRHDRLILMTTHHMEEADALGDRVAIMSAGQIKCCGSALFLKKVFNAGYHLRVCKSTNSWNQLMFDELLSYKYNLHEKLENITPHELMFQFNVDETASVLPKLFDDLEKYKEKIGIFGFGVTVSTMDDVFMKIGLHFNDVEAAEMQSKFEMETKRNLNPRGGVMVSSHPDQRLGRPAVISRVEGDLLFKQHVRALMAKRFHHARKNWFQLLWILAISLTCIASVVILLDFVIFKEELTPEWSREMTLVGSGYGQETTGVYQFSSPADELASIEALRDAAFPISSTNSGNSSATTAITSTNSTPTITSSTTTATSTSADPLTTLTPSTDKPDTAAIDREPLTSTESGLQVGSSEAPRSRREAQIEGEPQARSVNDSLQFLDNYWLNEARASGVRNLLTYTDVNLQMIDLLTRQFADFRERYIVGGEKAGKKYVAWYNGEATHSFPISMNIMLNSILRQVTDLIQDQRHPAKGSRISLTHVAMAQINTLIAFLPHLGRLINLVFLPFSLAFITSYFVIFPTHERVTKSKHLQFMTGVPARTFWLSHFIFDFLLYSAYTILMLAIYFVWDRILNDRRIYFANFEHSVALIALVIVFIFGALPLAYIFSFLAKKPTSAFSSFCVLTILTGTATLTLVSLYELKYEQTASMLFKITFTVFLCSMRLIPSVSLLIGLQKLFSLNTTRAICINISPEVLDLLCRYINSPLVDDELRVLRPERCCKQVCHDECYDQWPFFWTGWFGINVELAMLVFDACLYWFILVLIESRSIRHSSAKFLKRAICFPFTYSSRVARSLMTKVTKARKLYNWKVPQFSAGDMDKSGPFNLSISSSHLSEMSGKGMSGVDKELELERLKVDQAIYGNQMQRYSMLVSNLTKVYSANQHKAVDRLTFGVDKREFFGLLGVNGAGKSTTFKMLTGELNPTAGSSWVSGQELAEQRRLYLKQIGYCPQQDALIDNMTGAEMLTLFARLRGLPERRVPDLVAETLDKLGLKKLANIDCNNYSGGNKRRLSVGMALIGAPEVIFLDEPTSGVDPRSRRRLWSTLIDFQQQTGSSIVMTSHSMNECECLCDRVAIMVNGQFKVLGSIQYLRTRLSQGFSLVLKLKAQNLANQRDLVKMSETINDYMTRRAFGSSQIQLKDLHQTIMQYHIEPSAELSWSKMLLVLEKAKQELDLEDYQITSDASLESIFLSLAKQQNQGQLKQVKVGGAGKDSMRS